MKAVILAAGGGTRLRPLTNRVPKCLVEVLGKPILEHELASLEQVGVDHSVVVVGYLSELIRQRFGAKFGNMRLTYVNNQEHLTTNNLYSLWRARQQLRDDILLLDGDLLFAPELIADLIDQPHADAAIVEAFQPFMNGTVILAKGGVATSLVLKANQSEGFRYDDALKTVNIYKISQGTMREHFLPRLDWFVAHGHTDQFYEAVLAGLISEGKIQLGVHHTGNRRWIEVDTKEDLANAKDLFTTVQL